MDLRRAAAHFDRLRRIAEDKRVQLYLLAGKGIDWKGLYVYDDNLGPGIALNKELTIDWLAWILAHELGHHVEKRNRQLFSPFSSAIAAALPHTNGFPRRRKRDDSEHWVDQWAARTLIDEQEFIALENESPLDLPRIAGRLGLPTEAVLAWDAGRRDLASESKSIRVPAAREVIKALWEKSRGSGGHQSLLRRVVPTRTVRQLHLSFRDFSFARERLLTVRGGWREPYSQIVTLAAPAIRQAGGVTRCFDIPPFPLGSEIRP